MNGFEQRAESLAVTMLMRLPSRRFAGLITLISILSLVPSSTSSAVCLVTEEEEDVGAPLHHQIRPADDHELSHLS